MTATKTRAMKRRYHKSPGSEVSGTIIHYTPERALTYLLNEIADGSMNKPPDAGRRLAAEKQEDFLSYPCAPPG